MKCFIKKIMVIHEVNCFSSTANVCNTAGTNFQWHKAFSLGLVLNDEHFLWFRVCRLLDYHNYCQAIMITSSKNSSCHDQELQIPFASRTQWSSSGHSHELQISFAPQAQWSLSDHGWAWRSLNGHGCLLEEIPIAMAQAMKSPLLCVNTSRSPDPTPTLIPMTATLPCLSTTLSPRDEEEEG